MPISWQATTFLYQDPMINYPDLVPSTPIFVERLGGSWCNSVLFRIINSTINGMLISW